MSEAQKEQLLAMTEWQVWGLGIKRGWSNDELQSIIKWHRTSTKPNQMAMVKEVFGDVME